MSLPVAILMLAVGCALTWVAVHGTEASTPWGVFQEITKGLSGQSTTATAGATGREESATVTDPTAGRTNEPAGPTE